MDKIREEISDKMIAIKCKIAEAKSQEEINELELEWDKLSEQLDEVEERI